VVEKLQAFLEQHEGEHCILELLQLAQVRSWLLSLLKLAAVPSTLTHLTVTLGHGDR
jgi:hypothetical protein